MHRLKDHLALMLMVYGTEYFDWGGRYPVNKYQAKWFYEMRDRGYLQQQEPVASPYFRLTQQAINCIQG